MEWMLQVMDELDDLFGALRLCFVGVAAELGLIVTGGLAAGGIGAAIAAGAEMTLICSAAALLCLATTLKIQKSRI